METIRVNMTPCEDAQTIHASQNDNEAREWGFELHNNGEKIDSSSISDQLVFKAYKGGTEQILPENGSTPTTSPFKGVIKYPQGLLSDQEFLYRESPTESDGLAKITDIKGNTLVWNQLVQPVQSTYTKKGITVTGNNDGSFTISGTAVDIQGNDDKMMYTGGRIPVIKDHYYFVKGKSPHFGFSTYSSLVAVNVYNTDGVIAKASATGTGNFYFRGNINNGDVINETIYPQIFDLTQMGLDISDPSEFTSLFSLPYYAYNTGTLLSFNGTGIKTANEDESEEHTTTLPISTYFPTGMKSAGTVYDELLPSKAITRIGSVDLGSLEWTYRTTGSTYAPYFYASFTGIKPNGNPNVRKANILCSKYSTVYRGQDVFIDKTICADGSSTELTQLQIKDSSYTDATAFKTAMNGVMLYYELATYEETSFTTASLVTENAEIPLSNEDGILIGKCTEELSIESGFFDAKIKLADEDGECYSNKIQLHVERSPQ